MRPPLLPALLALAAAGPAAAADRAHPTVVELFQSQGCSSCPPANAQFLTLVDRPDVLALAFQVTYWDGLGWKDTFAHPAFTARQWDYARAWSHKQVATPQVVVDGRTEAVGSQPGEIAALVAKSPRTAGPELRLSPGAVEVAAGAAAKPADVWLVRYDPRTVQVPVKAGENAGKTLPHRDVVRELVKLGSWNGRAVRFVAPKPTQPGLLTAVLVQAGPGGPILAAARG